MSLTLEQGREIVSYARKIIESSFGGDKPPVPESLKKVFAENRGVFVTLERHPERDLRGCIGFPEPTLPLGRAIEEAAVSSAASDPRFPPVRKEEMDNITVEVSILTPPEIIKVEKPTDYPKKVVVGRDGLIAERGYFRGLLLPQVPVEWKWDAEEFLSHTCMKAGLPPDCWLDGKTKLYSFQAQIFSEESPHGEVVEKDISKG
jgi:uncharacterized protein (TIGR00296 family)